MEGLCWPAERMSESPALLLLLNVAARGFQLQYLLLVFDSLIL